MATQVGDVLTIDGITGRLMGWKAKDTVVLYDGKKNHYIKVDISSSTNICTDCKQARPLDQFARFRKGTLRKQCKYCFAYRIRKGTAKTKVSIHDNEFTKATEREDKMEVEQQKQSTNPVNPVRPVHYPEKHKDLIAKWHDVAPSFEAFAFAIYTHMDKYGYRFLNKNGSEDLNKMTEYATRLHEYQVAREQEEVAE